MLRKISYFALPLVAVFLFAFKTLDEGTLEKIMAKLQAYRVANPQEKVYLHFDKPYYSAGENVWFKAYLFEASAHFPDSASRVLYVDLIDTKNGKTIQQDIVEMDHVGRGDFALSDTLKEGTYHIRAYTNWMRNFSDEFFFHKDIKIWQTSGAKLDMAKIEKLAEVADFQFFPEGGNLVQGLQSRVGFKAVNSIGKGIDVEGFVLDGKDTITAFQSEHRGMGTFPFMPEAGKQYIAKVKKRDGFYLDFPLPKPLEQGFAMAADNISSKDLLKVYIFNSNPQPAEKATDLFLIAQQRGNVCFTAKGTTGRKSFGANIPRSKFPADGIVQITLFAAKGVPQCERLVFINLGKQLSLKITSDKPSYKPREKVTLNLEATDSEGKPIQGNFSLAVTDADQVKSTGFEENILSYLLLSSDISPLASSNTYFANLKGTVEEPAYYFDKKNEEAARHLDFLLMTQGWRRFIWNTMLKQDSIPKPNYLVEAGHFITGKVLRPNGKLFDKPVKLTLMIKKAGLFMTSETDKAGGFGFYSLSYSDTTEVLVQAEKSNGGRALTLTLDGITPPKYVLTKIPYNPIEFDATEFDNFLKRSKEAIELEKKSSLNKNKVLEEVVVKGKKTEEPDVRRLYGKPQNSLEVGDFSCNGFSHPLQLLQGKMAGVSISPASGGNGFTANIRGAVNLQGAIDPLYLIDGIPTDASGLMSISPCDIETVDVLKGADAAIYGSRAAGGVIAFLTKRGNKNYDYSKQEALGIVTQKRLGFTTPREFYAPKYDQNLPQHVNPDFRSTLHWEPMIKTDANGKASITFWNTDASTQIRANIEGASLNGLAGFGTMVYGVK